MWSVLNKLTLQKKLQNFATNNVFLDKQVKHNNNKTNKSVIKTLDGAGNKTRDISHRKRMHYLCTAESTVSNDCSQAI